MCACVCICVGEGKVVPHAPTHERLVRAGSVSESKVRLCVRLTAARSSNRSRRRRLDLDDCDEASRLVRVETTALLGNVSQQRAQLMPRRYGTTRIAMMRAKKGWVRAKYTGNKGAIRDNGCGGDENRRGLWRAVCSSHDDESQPERSICYRVVALPTHSDGDAHEPGAISSFYYCSHDNDEILSHTLPRLLFTRRPPVKSEQYENPRIV